MNFDADPVGESLAADRLARAKHAYTTRHIDTSVARGLCTEAVPLAGDVVLARIVEIGQHPKIELTHGRRATLFPGDEVVVAYGDRYAPDQFQAALPTDLGPCELVAAGGIAARVEAAHGKMSTATTLEPLGLLIDETGRRLNLRDARSDQSDLAEVGDRPVTVAVVGSSMNAGKTTSAAHLVRGLRLAGVRVGAAKVTGTGAGGDVWLLSDAGAFPVYDFTFAGVPTTYRIDPSEVLRVFDELTTRLAMDGCEAIVLEVADGIYQQETAALLEDPMFAERVDGVLFAASDALSATAAIGWLTERNLDPLALTGVLSSSPLATSEAEDATGRQVWGLEHLENPAAAAQLMSDLGGRRPVSRSAAGNEDPDPAVETRLAAQTESDDALAAAAFRRIDIGETEPVSAA